MTIYQLISILKEIALTVPNVRSATDGSIYAVLNANPSIEYDVVHFTQNSHQETEFLDIYGLTIFFDTRLEDDLESNRLLYQSQGKEVISNIIRTFCDNFGVDFPNITYTPYTQRFVNLDCGVYCTIRFEIPKEIICPDDFIQEVIPGKPIKLQDLGITITENGLRVITPGPGFDGIGEIRIQTEVPQEPVNLQHKEVEYSDNGEYSVLPDDGYDGLSDVSVSVSVATGSSDENLIANIQGDYFIIPEGTTSIRPKAFADCQFSAITIPDTVESIGYEAFAYNYELESITIPSSVSYIGYSAFIDCPLTSMTFEGMVPPQIEWDSLGWGDMEFPIYVPCEALNAYREAFAEQYADRVQCNLTLFPLTFIIESDGVIMWKKDDRPAGSVGLSIEYSKNGGEWTDITATVDGVQIPVEQGDTVAFRGDNMSYLTDNNRSLGHFESTCEFSIIGNISSMSHSVDFVDIDDVEGNVAGLFRNCTGLTDASNLHIPNHFNQNSTRTYTYLFYGCTSLTTAPELPATTLTERCYEGMFYGCTSLTTVPELPATTLAESCYSSMFSQCTSILNGPSVLPATIVLGGCYSGMFNGCTSLTGAPIICATTFYGRFSCLSMFDSCTSLTTAPELPATTLADDCYRAMFRGCTSLTTAPELPATTLVSNCYWDMFMHCTNLNYIKCLATNPNRNYTLNWVMNVASSGIFWKADGVSESTWGRGEAGIPSNWTVVDNNSYIAKPLTFLSLASLSRYLSGSNSGKTIQYRVTLSGDTPGEWKRMTINRTSSNNRIPLSEGATLEIKGNSPVWSELFEGGAESMNVYGNIMSLVAGDDFTTATTLTSSNNFINLFRSDNIVDASNLVLPATSLTESCYNSMFQGCTALTAAPAVLPATNLSGANGCYHSMFDGCTSLTGTPVICATTLSDYCFANMFNGCTHLTDASSLELPATTLSEGCYGYMFYGCSSLTGAPVLSATTLAPSCYAYMFSYCSSLDTAPALPATDLTDAGYCYDNMFGGCFSLTDAPNLPATALSESCYADMFSWCENLTGTPVLACMDLEYECYRGMFQGCTSLTTAPALPATTLADDCYRYMFIGCSSLTGAPVLPATALTNACYAEMFQDCSSLTGAPELLAPIMTNECYRNMFTNCESLQYIKCLATGNTEESDGGCCFTDSWVEGVPEGGTFVKDANMSDWEIDSNNGIPYNWTVQDDN